MIDKGKIRPDIKQWNKEKLSMKDLDQDVKKQIQSNLGIPLIPIHKLNPPNKAAGNAILNKKTKRPTEA